MARPRDPAVDERLLAAAQRLAEQDGLDAVTMSAVAEAARVSRPTVYRRFGSRAALVFEVQLRSTLPDVMPDMGSFTVELHTALVHLVRSLRALDRKSHGEQLAAMMADRAFAEHVWGERWIPDRAAVLVIWERGVARGEVDPAVDGPEFLNDVVAAVVFRFLLWHQEGEEWLGPLVDRFCRGVMVPRAGTAGRGH